MHVYFNLSDPQNDYVIIIDLLICPYNVCRQFRSNFLKNYYKNNNNKHVKTRLDTVCILFTMCVHH